MSQITIDIPPYTRSMLLAKSAALGTSEATLASIIIQGWESKERAKNDREYNKLQKKK